MEITTAPPRAQARPRRGLLDSAKCRSARARRPLPPARVARKTRARVPSPEALAPSPSRTEDTSPSRTDDTNPSRTESSESAAEEAADEIFAGLLNRAAQGDDRAVDSLVGDFIGPIAAFVRGRGADDPEEMANWVLYQGLHNHHPSRGTTRMSFRAMLYTIARRRLIDETRHRSARPNAVSIGDEQMQMVPDHTAAAFDNRLAETAFVRDLLGGLSPGQREVIELRFLEDLSIEDTAIATGKDKNAVKQIQHRAIRSLRRALGVVAALVLVWIAARALDQPETLPVFSDGNESGVFTPVDPVDADVPWTERNDDSQDADTQGNDSEDDRRRESGLEAVIDGSVSAAEPSPVAMNTGFVEGAGQSIVAIPTSLDQQATDDVDSNQTGEEAPSTEAAQGAEGTESAEASEDTESPELTEGDQAASSIVNAPPATSTPTPAPANDPAAPASGILPPAPTETPAPATPTATPAPAPQAPAAQIPATSIPIAQPAAIAPPPTTTATPIPATAVPATPVPARIVPATATAIVVAVSPTTTPTASARWAPVPAATRQAVATPTATPAPRPTAQPTARPTATPTPQPTSTDGPSYVVARGVASQGEVATGVLASPGSTTPDPPLTAAQTSDTIDQGEPAPTQPATVPTTAPTAVLPTPTPEVFTPRAEACGVSATRFMVQMSRHDTFAASYVFYDQDRQELTTLLTEDASPAITPTGRHQISWTRQSGDLPNDQIRFVAAQNPGETISYPILCEQVDSTTSSFDTD